MKFSKKNIFDIYENSKKNALNSFNANCIEKSLKQIKIAAHTAYTFAFKYCDTELEKLLKNISTQLFKTDFNFSYKIDDDKIVFYDSFSYDNKGLTQQYIRFLIAYNFKFLYISESSRSNPLSLGVFNEIKSYKNSEIFEIPKNLNFTEQAKIIYQKIISFNPSKLFMHISPSAVSAVVAFYSLPKNIIKYQINLTDHSFWLGNECLDYSLEFRSKGCVISKDKRNLQKNQILLQPFYPIISSIPFSGFPLQINENNVIIFSGGAIYKILGDNGEYFKIVEQIINENTNAIILFAGIGDTYLIEEFIKRNKFENNFFLLHHRKDIGEVFKHCDIYLGTYPFVGGLMSQYAAFYEKPLLNYMTDNGGEFIEDLICHNSFIKITHTDKDSLLNEAKLLINNKEYRKQRGKEIKSCLFTKEQFEKKLYQTISTNNNQIQYKEKNFDYKNVFENFLEIENKYQDNFKLYLIKNYKFKILFIYPKILFWVLKFFFSKKGIYKIKKIVKVRLIKNDTI